MSAPPGLRVLAALLAASAPLAAQVAPLPRGGLADRVRVDPRFWIVPAAVPLAQAPGALDAAAAPAWAAFRLAAGGAWAGFVDPRSGLVESAEGSGVPWVPGRGNALTWAEVDPRPAGTARDTLALLESRARDLLARLGPALGVRPGELALNRARSGAAADHLWLVDFDVVRDGLAVEGARVVLRVNHGNLIQLGSEALPAPGTPTPRFTLTRAEAEDALAAYVGGFGPGDVLLDSGSRRLLPTNPEAGAGVSAARRGYGLAAVWELLFRRAGDPATWRARVDAATGEVLELYDVNRYAGATGGVYPRTVADGNETVRPLPYVDLSTGGYADGAGVYPYADGPLSSRLDGRFVRISDGCGPISLSAGAKGDLAFGASGGTDCATPGVGGPGNTHATRSQYYHLQRAKDAAGGWLPVNSWLGAQLPANVNFDATCNAFWNGQSVVFFRSGDGCANTGEIADVGVHEFAHGLDDHDGTPATGERGTGETYGDVTAALTARDSCIGEGFFLDGTCDGYGDACTECTGVRDIDWRKHAAAVPHTVANFVQPLCPVPLGFPYVGPCGAHAIATGQSANRRQGHCESYVSSEALWDLAARDLPDPGSAAAWAAFERLWYRSRSTATRAFVCDTSTPVWTSHGCTAGSYWRAMRAADDDDGNLANGTPHSCHLFAAFDRHGIACPADPAAGVCHAACTPPAAPSLTAAADDGVVRLAWGDAGPGVVYDLFRGEAGCGAGTVKIAAGLAATSYEDVEVANFFTYSYRVVAYPAGNEACSAAPSDCAAATPAPCPIPGPPAVLAAATPHDNEVALSWASGSPPAARFNVYRARASCAAGSAAFAPLATGVTATAHLDLDVSGTLAYAYRVTATDPTGVCESAPACVEVTPTGPCTAAPEFAGLSAVRNPGSPQCALDLSWPPAQPLCGGPATYDVHRGGAAGFAPTAANRIAAGLAGRGYVDAAALANGQTYVYLVRARDAANGIQDGNLVYAGAAPTGPTTTFAAFVETFEAPGGFDHPGWELATTFSHSTDPGPGWTWVPAPAGGSAWFADEHTAPSGKALVSPPFNIGPSTAVSFRHRFALQAEPAYCRDGGTLELSTDAGATWGVVPDTTFRSGGFTNTVVDGVRNPLEGKRAWCGSPMGGMTPVEIDLSAFAGTGAARLRWHEGDDDDTAVTEPNGWYVDSVTIRETRIEACSDTLPALDFYTLPPCRVLDTRDPPGPFGGPGLPPASQREIALAGRCGVPSGARAVTANVTVTAAGAPGFLQLFPTDLQQPPTTSVVHFGPGQTRSSSALLPLSSDGQGRLIVANGSDGGVHVIIDVAGFFR